MGGMIDCMMAAWKSGAVNKNKRKAWLAVSHSIIWSIWRCSNKLAFEEAMLDVQKFKLAAISTLWKGGAPIQIQLLNFIGWLGQ